MPNKPNLNWPDELWLLLSVCSALLGSRMLKNKPRLLAVSSELPKVTKSLLSLSQTQPREQILVKSQ